MSGWQSRNRLRPGTKHLCGQTCLHKLVDEFMAKAIASRPQTCATSAVEAEEPAKTDTSLTSNAAYCDLGSSAHLITSPSSVVPIPAPRLQAELVAMPGRILPERLVAPPEESRFASRNWRAEAWERERERELRAIEHRPDIARRRSSA
ncbi:MAG TPA: hypothetical protein VH308_10515 [Terracidiphilus sp.]|nr:hypothetical protein [Terracidiphilus sp.]